MRPMTKISPASVNTLDMPDWLVSDLRSDHAGETGAVWIYKGVLAVSRDKGLRTFAREHLETEQRHLQGITQLLPHRHSLLIPIWKIMGFMTGGLPALFGASAVYATVEAVETFVDQHYAEQVARLDRAGILPEVRDRLEQYRLDEVHHRDDAGGRLTRRAGPLMRLWCRLVGSGSAIAVWFARRV